jgi:hypothetical protein
MMRHFASRTLATGSGRPRGRLSLLLTGLGATVALVLMTAGAALAYFAATDSSNPAAALAATLAAPTGGTQNGASTVSSIPIKWTAPAGYTATSYTVLRCRGTCTPTAADTIANGTCSGPITATSCTDTDAALQPSTSYTYDVEANLHYWVSPADTFKASTSSGSSGAEHLAFVIQPRWHKHIQATGRHDTFDVSVAVESSSGSAVTNDNSDKVTLAISNNPGGGALTCASSSPGLTASVSDGVAAFTGCNIDKAGRGYTLTATSSTSPSLVPPANARAFDIVAGPPAQLAFISEPVSGVASPNANLGPITVELQDSDGNPVDTGLSGATVSLASSPSPGVVFAATQNGTPATAVTIPPGSDSVSFFFGDASPGSPVLTASGLGHPSARQTETVNKPAFSATDLGNARLICSGGWCSGPSVTATSGSTELIFAYVAESRYDSTALTGVTGPFSGTPSNYSDEEFERVAGGGVKDNFLFAAQATGDGSTGAVTLSFDHLSNNATVWIDIVQLGAGDTVITCSTACADGGVGSPASVLTRVASSSDSEIAFAGTADAASFTPPSSFTGLGGGGSSPYGTWADPAVAAASKFGMSASGDGWGSIGVEVSP